LGFLFFKTSLQGDIVYISRISKDGRKQKTVDHLIETSEYAASIGKKLGISELARLAAILHDIGKFQEEFVEYLEANHARELAGEKTQGRGSVIHSTQGAKFIYELRQSEEDDIGSLVSEICALAISCHHGSLMDVISPDGDTPFHDRISKNNLSLNYEKVIGVAEENLGLKGRINGIFQKAKLEVAEFIDKCEKEGLDRHFMLHLLTKSLYSCLIDADRYNAYCFDIGVKQAQSDPSFWNQLTKKFENYISTFPNDSEINKIRKTVSDYCYDASSRPKGIYRLEVPTGGGKTLSSFRFALNHANAHGAERIIYVIPYLSVIDQTAKEIKKALDYSEEDGYILEHHSNFIVEKEDKMDEYNLLTERWDSPIIITTMVQFLESIYSAKASDLRKLHNLANSVIIFDEVQSIPVKCIHLFTEVLNFLHFFGGCTILLCSATQPPLHEIPKAIFLSENPSLIPEMSEPFRKLKRARIIDKTRIGGYTIEELRDFILEVYKKEGNCLVITNTRGEAKKLFTSLKDYFKDKPDGAELYHLSTLMYPKHRLEIIEKIKKEEEKRKICISTQLIEAGVDISFKAVIRVLAGLDSIIQSAGRCNRHGKDPEGKEVYIVNLYEENLDKLPDIKTGSEITRRILSNNPSDLLSDDCISNYYKEYFYKREEEMSYQRKKGKGTIYDLLSKNPRATNNMKNRGKQIKTALTQAFSTAAEEFSVIENSGIGVIVLKDESRQILSELRNVNLKKKLFLIRKLGKFTINLYKHQIQDFGGALKLTDDGFYVLNGYYDDKLGVINELNQDFLCY